MIGRRRLPSLLAAALICAFLWGRATPAPASDVDASPVAAATAKLRSGDLVGASELLEVALEDPQADPEAKSLLGAIYLRLDRPEDALEVLASLAATDEADALALFNAGRAALALDLEEKGEEYLIQSVRRAPVSQATLLLAERRALQGRFEEVVALLAPMAEGAAAEQIARNDPASAGEIALRYATAKFEIGLVADAIGHLEQAATLLPESPAVWKLLGEALLEDDRIEEARQALARAQVLAGEEHERSSTARVEAERLMAEAFALRKEGAFEAALARLREALVLTPDDPRLREAEIQALAGLGRTAEALGRADALAAMIPGNPQVLLLRASLRLAARQWNGAESDLRAVLDQSPEHLGALKGLADLLWERDRGSEEALTVLRRILVLAPDDRQTAERLRLAEGESR